jgi:DNA polymerase III subunit epsilon
MRILGLDFETTGLDAQKDRITEAGIVLYDTEARQPVRISGFLVKAVGAVISSEIEQLTGISNTLVEKFGVQVVSAISAINKMAAEADFFCAHNAEFDRGFYQNECQRVAAEPIAKPWIDTRTDLPVAAYQLGKSASLRYMAADHGFLYPAHRAVDDVLAMFRILAMYDINETVKRAQTPNVQVRAVVSFDDKHLAKERGYYWKADAKLWIKPLKADEVDAEKLAAPFPVVLMESK